MSPTFHIICSFALTYGPPMAFAGHEIWKLRRDEGGGWREDMAPIVPKPKPLPDCLIPKLMPLLPQAPQERERELELV